MTMRQGCITALVIWAVLSFLFALQAFSATFYVDNTCSTNGNGTTQTCGASGPWNSIKNAMQTSDCSGMSAGDIMEIKGDTAFDPTCQQTGTHCYFEDNVNIEGACHDIIVQNKAGTFVTVNGTQDIKTATWSKVGCGVYKCTNSQCSGLIGKSFASHAWYDTGGGAGEQELVTVQTSTACDDTLPPGKMTVNTTDQTACVHLADGTNPASAKYIRVPWASVFLGASADSADNMTFRKNPSGGGQFTVERYRRNMIELNPGVNTGWVLDGLVWNWAMDRCVAVDGTDASAAMQIKNNTISFCGQEGIRMANDNGAWLVENNTITDIQTTPTFERCNGIGAGCLDGFSDNGTGIRIVVSASGGGGIARGNTILRVGGGNKGNGRALNVEHTGKNITIENNYIADSYGLDADGNGIIFTCDFASSFIDGLIVRNNRIFNVDKCLHFASGSSCSSQSGKTNYVVNNTCSNVREHGLYVEGAGTPDGTYKFQNNIISGGSVTPSANLVFIQSNASGWTNFENNRLYCPSCTTNQNIVSWKGTTFRRDGDCTPGTNCMEDMNSIGAGVSANDYGNPLITDTGTTYPNLKITSTSSVAYDTGKTIAEAPKDYLGSDRPQGSAYDVGAHELVP